MKRLYEKNELLFALLWIGVYVVSFSAADSLSDLVGTQKLITVPVGLVLTAVLVGWLLRNGLAKHYGFAKLRMPLWQLLYFLPLAALVSLNFWDGVQLPVSVTETVLYMLSMICVGILEEVIFRGLLFRAICKDNVKLAILISSLTFGMGHVLNLAGGAQLIPTLLQILYATAAGFLFTVIFYKSGSLIPCIIAHCAVNALSVFCKDSGILSAVMMTVLPLAYGLWIWFIAKKKCQP